MQSKEQTFTDFKQFKRNIKAKNPEFEQALKDYFASGGIVRVLISTSKEWPELIYPSQQRLRTLIKKKKEQKQELMAKKAAWQKRLFNAELYNITNFLKKYAEPLYWRHIVKYLADSDYRNDAKSVKLPVNLVADPRWKPMIKMFVEDLDYRKQLRLTVEESFVYKKDKKLAKYSQQLIEFRKQESQRKIDELNKKITKLDKEIRVLKKLLRWAKA